MFILIVMCVGVLAGRLLFPEKLKRTNEIFQIICTLTLIFAMGFSLGSDENFFQKLFSLGLESFLFFLIPSGCSLLLVFFLTKRFFKSHSKEKETEEK